ncbi:bifunctional hydroxymethylpyrimidine kinase/phosphomethylpyrimidine kinase [bacterium]|nr:bifunctional hydroxymethylpyrimidine kinase/phosphomethylpyrimidine kinase [bacterium]
MAKPILVVGSAALDSVEGPAGKVEDALGGSSFFFSTAASLMAPVNLVAVIGTDFPMEKIEYLKDRNVDLEGLEVAEGETFRWAGRYLDDPNQRETLYTKLGVFEEFSPKIPEHFRSTPLVFLGNIHPALQLQVLDQIEKPELVVLDTMNFWIHGTPDELKKAIELVDVLIVNDEEAFDLTGKSDLRNAANDLMSRGPRAIVVKKGQHGAVLYQPDEDIFFAPAFPVQHVVDPTGAGDTFAAGFLGYLANHPLQDPMSWRRAIVNGSVVASYVVEDFSMNRTKALTNSEIESRFNRFREMTQF